MAVDTMELLFFDTFSHESSEDLNLDLVQFPRPVYINEVRIIPLGARVQADFPGGVRLGATNPSQFKLEFFVNDLSKPGASTFEKLGSLDYKQNVDIQLPCGTKIPTDGLVLRGWYSTITLAVYGSITKLVKERTSPPPPPPPQSSQRTRSLVVEGRSPIERELRPSDLPIGAEWDRETRNDTDPRAAVHSVTDPVSYNEAQSSNIQDHSHYQYPDYENHFQDRWPQSSTSDPQKHNLGIQHNVPLPPPPSQQHGLPPHAGPPPPPVQLGMRHSGPSQTHGSRDSYSKERDYDRQPYSRDLFDPDKSNWESKDKDRERDDRRERDHRSQRDSRDREFRDPREGRDYRDRDRDRREFRERERDREYRDYPDHDKDMEEAWDKTNEGRDSVERSDREYRDYRERSSERDNDRDFGDRPPEPDRDREFRDRDREARGNRDKDHSHRDQDMRSRESSRESQRTESKRPRTPPRSYSPKPRRPRTPPLPTEFEPQPIQQQPPPQQQPSPQQQLPPPEPQQQTQPPPPPQQQPQTQQQLPPKQPPPPQQQQQQPTSQQTPPPQTKPQALPTVSTTPPQPVSQQQQLQQPQQQSPSQPLQQPQSQTQPVQQPPVQQQQLQQQQQQPPRSRGPCSPPPPAIVQVKEDIEPGEVAEEKEEICEPMSPEASPEPVMETFSDGEIQEGESTDAGYGGNILEDILSDEEYMSDAEDRPEVDLDYELGDDPWNYISSFNPYQCEVSVPLYFAAPNLTVYEVEKKRMGCPPDEASMESAQRLLKTIELFQDKEHSEKWVETVETIPTLLVPALAILLQSPELKGVLDTLLDWVCEALNFEKALAQAQPVYKVRHLKAGIKLTTALANCDDEIFTALLKRNVQHLLLDLFTKDYMALSIKLLIVKALDALIRTEDGIKSFLTCKASIAGKQTVQNIKSQADEIKIGNLKWEENTNKATGYQRLLVLLLSKQSTRATVSLSALIRKVHTYEVAQKLKDTIESVLDTTAGLDSDGIKSANSDLEPEHHTTAMDVDVDTLIPCSNLNELDVDNILTCMSELLKVLGNAQQLIAQPRRSLPAKSQFEILGNPNNAYPGLYNILISKCFMEALFILLSSPAFAGHIAIFNAVKDILCQLLQTEHGLLFLLSQPEVSNGVIRLLLQSADDVREEGGEENAPHQLGLQIAFHLQALQYVDMLMEFHNREVVKKEVDDPEALAILQPFYTMVFTPTGRQAVVNVLSMEQNLQAIIPFIELADNEELDIKIKKSASMGYATELLLVVFRYSENIVLLKNFGEKLLQICGQEPSLKLQEISSWLSVIRRIPNYTYEAVPALCTVIKNSLDDVLSYPGELITAVRILKYLGVPPSSELKDENPVELKYKYVIVQLFANDGLTNFVSILQKICDSYQYPFQQNYAMIGPQWPLLLSLVGPLISLLKHILSHLIYCRNTEFKDLTTLSVLLRMYALLSTLPSSSVFFPTAQQIQAEIIEILLAYTQPTLEVSESEEALSKSLWTLMMNEVLKFVLTGPSTFVSGLTVMSELLPLPLPCQTKEALTNEEITKMINNRKLWSAHLHSLSSLIKDVIVTLSGSSYVPLQQLLRRVCVQLADLAAPTALIVVRSLLDAVLEGLEGDKEFELTPEVKFGTGHLARLLNLLSYLLSHSCIKAPLIQILRGSSKLDEKYTDLLQKLANLLNITSDKSSHIQTQECIVNIFQSLCDSEVTLMTGVPGLAPVDQLANALPPREQMAVICIALLEHVGNTNQTYATILPSLRALVMIVETDFGLFFLKSALDKKPSVLVNLCSKISSRFSKESSDCLSTLSTFMELLRLLVSTDDTSQILPRTTALTSQELSHYLGWKQASEESSQKHPLLELEKLLTDCVREEDGLETQLQENVSSMVLLLKEESIKVDRELLEPVIPQAESLTVQFASRAPYLIGDIDDDRLSPSYWLAQPPADESDQEVELVLCDLEAMADKFCQGLDLKVELGKESATKEIITPMKGKRRGQLLGKRRYQPLINPGSKERGNKKPFNPRGRGFSRGMVHTSRANDPFRSRPPNTSRPPSMHVDDFVALESFHPGAAPTGPTNKRPNKSNKESTRGGRGRGNFENSRGFGSGRGRFFGSQSSYPNRRDDKGRVYFSGGARGGARGGSNSWNNRSGQQSSKGLSKSNPNTPRGFQRGGHMDMRSSDTRSGGLGSRSQELYGSGGGGGGGGGGSSGGGRFGRGRGNPHWSGGSRGKDRGDARFSNSGGSGRGRREMGRHVRALTR